MFWLGITRDRWVSLWALLFSSGRQALHIKKFLCLILRLFKSWVFRGNGRIRLFLFKRYSLAFLPRLLLNWIKQSSCLSFEKKRLPLCPGRKKRVAFFFKIRVCMQACMSICVPTTCMQVPSEARRGCWTPPPQLGLLKMWTCMWVLGTEPGSWQEQ